MPSAPSSMLEPVTVTVVTRSAAETRLLGVRLGALLGGGDVVALHGFLGAGKTTLVQGIAAGLGVARPVTSPTFTLINEHHGRTAGNQSLRVLHVDVYRLGDASATLLEAESLGLEENLGAEDAIVLVEWAERIEGWLPPACLHVWLSAGAQDEQRLLTLAGRGARSADILAALSKAA